MPSSTTTTPSPPPATRRSACSSDAKRTLAVVKAQQAAADPAKVAGIGPISSSTKMSDFIGFGLPVAVAAVFLAALLVLAREFFTQGRAGGRRPEPEAVAPAVAEPAATAAPPAPVAATPQADPAADGEAPGHGRAAVAEDTAAGFDDSEASTDAESVQDADADDDVVSPFVEDEAGRAWDDTVVTRAREVDAEHENTPVTS